jgi:hypothetical protein
MNAYSKALTKAIVTRLVSSIAILSLIYFMTGSEPEIPELIASLGYVIATVFVVINIIRVAQYLSMEENEFLEFQANK